MRTKEELATIIRSAAKMNKCLVKIKKKSVFFQRLVMNVGGGACCEELNAPACSAYQSQLSGVEL